MKTAAIGFRAKTGRAIAVALTGPAAKPSFLWRREVSLVDPRVAETAQPYHVVMDLPWPDALLRAEDFVVAIEAVACDVLADLVRDLDVRRIAVVGSPDRPLEKIGNPHIRAHAAEGALFRRVLEVAAARHGLACDRFTEEEVRARRFDGPLQAIGAQAGKPWRADEKAAAAAAFAVLGIPRRGGRLANPNQ